jgi:hypothetical protein
MPHGIPPKNRLPMPRRMDRDLLFIIKGGSVAKFRCLQIPHLESQQLSAAGLRPRGVSKLRIQVPLTSLFPISSSASSAAAGSSDVMLSKLGDVCGAAWHEKDPYLTTCNGV